jgi:hypothetical protein
MFYPQCSNFQCELCLFFVVHPTCGQQRIQYTHSSIDRSKHLRRMKKNETSAEGGRRTVGVVVWVPNKAADYGPDHGARPRSGFGYAVHQHEADRRRSSTHTRCSNTLSTVENSRHIQLVPRCCFRRRLFARSLGLVYTTDPLYDPPPTPDMTLMEPFRSTDFATQLGQRIADSDTRPRKKRKLDKATPLHAIPEVRVFLVSHSSHLSH